MKHNEMTKRRRLLPIRPRVANASEAAAYIGVSLSKFNDMRKSGEFPIQALHYGKYFDLDATDAWLDKIGGLSQPPTNKDEMVDYDAAWKKASHG